MPEPRAHFELEVSHARAIAEAVTKVRGVAALDGGSFGSVSLYLPGERIVGMRRPDPRDDRHLQINIRVDISARRTCMPWQKIFGPPPVGLVPNCSALTLSFLTP